MIRFARRRPSRRAKDRAIITAATLVLCLPATTSTLSAQSAAPEPLITQAARQIGIKRCLPVIAATAKRVMAGATRQDIVVDWVHEAPDTNPLFSLTGLAFGTQSAALTLSAMPAADGRCSLMVERISVAPSPCSSVAHSELPGLAGTALVPNVTVYASQPNETYTLIGEGAGAAQSCLIIRRMTTFNWPPRR